MGNRRKPSEVAERVAKLLNLDLTDADVSSAIDTAIGKARHDPESWQRELDDAEAMKALQKFCLAAREMKIALNGLEGNLVAIQLERGFAGLGSRVDAMLTMIEPIAYQERKRHKRRDDFRRKLAAEAALDLLRKFDLPVSVTIGRRGPDGRMKEDSLFLRLSAALHWIWDERTPRSFHHVCRAALQPQTVSADQVEK